MKKMDVGNGPVVDRLVDDLGRLGSLLAASSDEEIKSGPARVLLASIVGKVLALRIESVEPTSDA